jgi:selenocysteine lyase/cysteine desulfurase
MTGIGNFYGLRPLQGMGVSTDTGVLRMSMIHYTTHQEVARLIAGLEAALS